MKSIEHERYLIKRVEQLEIALQIIQTWAACFDSRVETADKAMEDIENKCREALTTGEGE